MTTAKARQLTRRWFLAFAGVLAVRHALLAVGIDEFDLPLSITEVLAGAVAWRHYGWIDGYRAGHQATLAERETP